MLQVIYDPLYAFHNTGTGHPERAARLGAFVSGLEAGGVSTATFVTPQAATRAALSAVHPESYVSLVERVCASLGEDEIGELPTGDTVISRNSFTIASHAAGGALAAVTRAQAHAPTLAVVRPPGHHAGPSRGMGFCLFNNVAIAAAWARRERGNVLIADFDYHHGNGTQAWVERALDEPGSTIGFLSTHAYPAYPGTGAFGESRIADNGFVIDIPLPHSTATDDFIGVWSSLLPVAAQWLKPSVIIVSAGFDFLAGDPIAGLPVAQRAVDALCGLLGDVASCHQAGLALVLEGGYSLDNLRASGSSLAYDFGKHSSDVHVPQASNPSDERLRQMTAETLRWLTPN